MRFSDRFITYMLQRQHPDRGGLDRPAFSTPARNAWRARFCCLPAYGKPDQVHRVLPKIPQETLAQMVGTQHALAVNFFMNRFKKMGFIKYNAAAANKRSLS